jgi:fluoride exporter
MDLHSFNLVDQDNTAVASIYGLGSMVIGMMAVQLGVTSGRFNSKTDSTDG